ncbi:MAG: hypothetical protein MOIL_00553 [Candidatus Methanolliviera sp. GoM_oil]|nr:MAG: hypothetical protein MOIL_00553 [Candidatus Methanolliviera sp. GoM_oil]
MREQILNLIKKIFSQAGYRTEPSYEFDLIAEKGMEQIYAKFIDFPDKSDIIDLVNNVNNLDGVPLIISTSYSSSETRKLAEEHNISMWSRDEFETQIGKALLAGLEGKTTEITFARKETEASDFVPFMDFMATTEPEKVDIVEPNEPVEIRLQTLPINIDRSDAIAISKRQIKNPEILKIRFIPLWKYRYSIDIKKQYRSKDVHLSGDGVGEINALTGDPSNLSIRDFDLCDKIIIHNEEYVVEKPEITKEEAETMVMQQIMDRHSKVVQFSDVEGQAIIYEYKTFRPTEEDISLSFELIHAPVWEIKGHNGFFEVNAFNGDEVDTPLDDDTEFV